MLPENESHSSPRAENPLAAMFRALRRQILTPGVKATQVETRGFHVKTAASKDLLETVGRTFLTGYGFAAEARTVAEAETELEQVPSRFRGFAYEGAAMGFAVMDALPLTSGRRVLDALAARSSQHVYMAYIGVGWALARLPRFLWPDITAYDPLLRWLLLDGYGFHQAYFHTAKYVGEQFVDSAFSWPDEPASYANRVLDQGIGRALWFVCGTDAERVCTQIEGFAPRRHEDLYSGAALAATYAGGVDREELQLLRKRSGEHWPLVAQASAFAAEARVRAGLVVPHTGVATEILCGMNPHEAAQLTVRARPGSAEPQAGVAAYEIWRRQTADQFVSLGRC
ncbi:DUF1702 family protein [Amycolatopsis sp. cmx-11-12]|uniref:DUF1702 family protein n=1 Tax=Amycolatopsis sp. cmx-11-12 TaxID=2785795 RepID=UPI003917BEF8